MSKSPYDQFPNIITDEITLRKIIPSDIDSLFEIYSNEKLFLHSPVMLKKAGFCNPADFWLFYDMILTLYLIYLY